MNSSLTVDLGAQSYPIHFGRDLSADVAKVADSIKEQGRRIAVITDENLMKSQAVRLDEMFGKESGILVLPAGEGSKSLEGLGAALDFLVEQKLDRGGVVFAVGGGVVGDLAGFAAAAYLRGISFYQVPTTLLAMVDSSVGGKTGINLKGGKNLAGAFHQPKGVFISTGLLDTLPKREFAAGMAEVIKSGLLGDKTLFEMLEKSTLTVESGELADVVRKCCELKARVVEADQFETAKEGGRALLNLGHTFGHAVEQVSGYGHYLHGEAVAMGLYAAARLSEKLGYINADEVMRIRKVIESHGLPVKLREELSLNDLMGAISRDKKARGGLPRFVVLRSIGEAITQEQVPGELVEECFVEIGAER